MKHGFFKSVHKGEDTWSQKPGMKVPAAAGSKDGETRLLSAHNVLTTAPFGDE